MKPTSIGEGWLEAFGGENDPHLTKARSCAKGTYQTDLLNGTQAWSGSTLKGKAGQWRSKYHQSRTALLRRMKKAGVVFKFVTMDRRKVLVVGEPPQPPKPEPRPINTIADLFA